MTATERLRALVKEATPGPWDYDGRDIFTRARNPSGPYHIVVPLPETITREAQVPDADAELIALAPQLAELVADMGEALLRFSLDCMHLHEQAMADPFGCEAFVQERIGEIAASLDALFSEEDIT